MNEEKVNCLHVIFVPAAVAFLLDTADSDQNSNREPFITACGDYLKLTFKNHPIFFRDIVPDEIFKVLDERIGLEEKPQATIH